MDAVRILGGLLSQRAARTGGAGQVLGQVLNGIAAAKEQQRHVDPRFSPQHHMPLEGLVRDSVARHHHAGGHAAPRVTKWAAQHGQQYMPPKIRSAPRPRHDEPSHHQHQHTSGLGYNQRAELLLQAMIMAAQADGAIDAAEQDRIVQKLQPLDQGEVDWLRREFGRRHDVHDFVHAIPHGMEYEVYQVSLMAMDLDTHREADYLRSLAQCLRIDPQVCNQIHHRCGAANLF
ncbi:MAG: DUF533 domain-containing protein [Rubripirellula sp.]